MMFRAAIKEHIVEEQDDNSFVVPYTDDVYTPNGWVLVKNLKVGDSILVDNIISTITNIQLNAKNYILTVEGGDDLL